ncbi:alpha-ketoglutarate-dependent taurine dioxygenase [Paraburkholderia bryophila]|uniref:Alpha-ketoglutarate-dependent taurine dioxygenase n=1 Tax=Paraburkholderia bryophila TaxID=420952 RepID=A0A329CV08_9BURK|nr:alpha-ketoglutarate-dependent taurine dioxygenase [Paraburkholderia bryophila]
MTTLPQQHLDAHIPSSHADGDRDAALQARFADVFQRIAVGAVAREQKRELAHEAVQWLREAGFPALRVPQRYGGGGVTLPQFFRLLIGLGEADSNLPQILRLNVGFIENLLEGDDEATRERWLTRVANGELVGAALSERTASTHNSVTLTRDPHDPRLWRLNGEKYYSTGSLYADWINVNAHDGEHDVNLMVRGDAPGVNRIDDWDGFGQRLTASGTTRFDNVEVTEEQILLRHRLSEPQHDTFQIAFYQNVHLATLAGIARAALRDATAFARAHTRTFGVPGKSSPRDNPLVQRVIGRLASLSYAADSLVNALAQSLERVSQARAAGRATEATYIALDIEAYQAQQIVIAQVLEATTLLFEVGGASATSERLRLDRHWRNARVISSHNPAIQREQAIGAFHLNGTSPSERFSLAHGKDAKPATVQAGSVKFSITRPDGVALGAQVSGLDAARELDAQHILALKQGLLDHRILVFRGQQLDDTQYRRLAGYFGSIYTPPRNAPVLGSDAAGAVPDIVVVSNVDDGLLGNHDLPAHSDHHWTPEPSSGSLLYALEVPEQGGDTSWYDLVAAYEALDEATRARIDGLKLITYNPFLRRKFPLDGGAPLYRTPNITPLEPWVAHPLVRTHPQSGKRLLYLGLRTEVEIVDYDPVAGAALIEKLRAHLSSPRFFYTHKWQAGDIVYWDNQATLHARTEFEPSQRRVLKRISLAGSRPF